VNDAWVFRLPKRKEVEPDVDREIALLPALRARLPIAVPFPERVGAPGADYPYRFAGYRFIPGTPALRLEPADLDLDRFAAQMGGFLSALHAFPAEEAERLGVERRADPRLHARLREEALDLLEGVAPAYPEEARRAGAFLADDRTVPAPFEGRPVLVHNDLQADHILIDPATREVVGVIDWGDVSVADPALDFAGLWHYGGGALVKRVLERYQGEVRSDLERFARFSSACIAVSDLAYAVREESNAYARSGLRGLENALG
jgi:aminoglycoside phosphotransferase (APT) family kinase protein